MIKVHSFIGAGCGHCLLEGVEVQLPGEAAKVGVFKVNGQYCPREALRIGNCEGLAVIRPHDVAEARLLVLDEHPVELCDEVCARGYTGTDVGGVRGRNRIRRHAFLRSVW